MHNTRHAVDHVGAVVDSHSFAQRLAADRNAGNQRRYTDGHQHRCGVEIPLQLRHDHRSGRTADDAADIAHHVVAERADLVGLAQ